MEITSEKTFGRVKFAKINLNKTVSETRKIKSESESNFGNATTMVAYDIEQLLLYWLVGLTHTAAPVM